jgi:hypothetical protein
MLSRSTVGLVLFFIAVPSFALLRAPRGSEPPNPDTDLVVHEWGTFTSMQGSDGIALEGLQHEEESLPEFVYSRSKVRACPLRDRGYKGLECDVEHVTRKMETPVIYFYSARARRERVHVSFDRGLLTQWFPVVDLLGPPERSRTDGPLDLSRIERSFLEWDVDVLPPGAGIEAIPAAKLGEPWTFQRLPDSNVVRTIERVAPRIGPVESEKFLFYRGLGTFDLPIAARASGGSSTARANEECSLSLSNRGGEELRGLFVLQVQGTRGSFVPCPEIPARSASTDVSLDFSRDSLPIDAMVEKLIPALESKLVAAGLFPKEAEAMARTWERSYFRTEGLRVLYLVPEKLTQTILPLSIDPPPASFVRVLVGRLECVTPAVEAEVESALRDRRSASATSRRDADARLERLGRFLEPHLRRAIASTSDDLVRESARELLARL